MNRREGSKYESVAQKLFWIWGGLDVFSVLWYCLNSWQLGRMPYIADFSNMLDMHGQLGAGLASVAFLSWGLSISIVLSAIGFIAAWRPVRYLAYAQILLRLFFLLPSFSLLLPFAGYLPVYLLLPLVLASEIIKGWSLWKFASEQGSKLF